MTEAEPRKGDWMQTYTGRQFWPLDPRPEDVDIRDIARSHAMMCRYAGHVGKFYSVAEHCCHIFDAAADLGPEGRLWALLHDAAEAYVVDVPRPVKPYLTNYRGLEDGVMAAIAAHFGLPMEMPAAIKELDRRILADERAHVACVTEHEWSDCGPALGIEILGWQPIEAERQFLSRFYAAWASLQTERAVHAAFMNGTGLLQAGADMSGAVNVRHLPPQDVLGQSSIGASEMAALREQLKSVTAEIEQAFQIPAESLRRQAVELGVSKLEPLFASVMERVLAEAGVEDEKAEAKAEADGYCTDCESETMLTDGRCACGSGRVFTEPVPDYFGQLVGRARQAAEKAIQKYPQPNYVALKIAEEAGEVVRGAVHYAEGRMQWQEVEGEIVQLLAMLFRFVTEGDQVLGALPPEQGAAVKAEVPSDD
ncbi:MAG: hypothetical protein ACK4HD_16845 [Pannonibacter phragmitetus]